MQRAVAGILIHNNKILIGKKILKEGHFCSGGWHLPGGKVRDGEDDKLAILREFKEETNFDIVIIEKITTAVVLETDTEISWFAIKPSSSDPFPGDDLTEIKFVGKKEVEKECDNRAVSLWPREVLEYLRM